MTTEMPSASDREQTQLDLVASLLQSLAISVLVAAATVGALRFIESWEGSPELGTATYLFWPMLAGAATLWALAARLKTQTGPSRAS